MDRSLLSRLVSEYELDTIYHLAALLSTRSEFTPEAAHNVNVEGTLGLLNLAAEQSDWRDEPVKFIFPSSIAAYGLPDLETKAAYTRVREWEWNNPRTMYGCNKLYCEQLGIYYSKYYRQLAADLPVMLDFRCLRFPGLISAFTVPSGGTSDYGPEMLHYAAQKKPYACFVREDVRIPFMVMPDAVKSLLLLTKASKSTLKHSVYNVTSFSLSAAEFRDWVLKFFPDAQITFQPDVKRQTIVDSGRLIWMIVQPGGIGLGSQISMLTVHLMNIWCQIFAACIRRMNYETHHQSRIYRPGINGQSHRPKHPQSGIPTGCT